MANSSSANFTSLANNTFASNMAYPCDFLSPTRTASTGKILAYSILILAGFFGNILTVLVLYTNKSLRDSMDLYIVNMAVSNLVIPCIVLPYQIVKTTFSSESAWLVDGIAGEIMCKFVFIVADMCPVVAIYSLVGMTGDRFLAVVYRSKPTKNFIRFRLLLTWLVSLGLFSPYFYTFRLHLWKGRLRCLQRWSPALDHVTAQRAYFTIVLVVAVIVPFCLLTIMYSAILITMTKCLPYFKPQTPAGRQRRSKAIRSTTVQALALVVVFGLCYGPYNVIVLIWAFALDWHFFKSCELRILFFCAQFLTYAYTCISPSVYFVFFPKYKRALMRVLNCQSS